MKAREFKILMVEDDEGDSDLALEAIHDLCDSIVVDVAQNGEEAIQYLENISSQELKLPEIIILDLNLPKKDGRETLKEIKMNSKWQCIPVIIFTTSDAEKDIQTCYNLGCNSYINKPVGLDDFYTTFSHILDYWFKIVRLVSRD